MTPSHSVAILGSLFVAAAGCLIPFHAVGQTKDKDKAEERHFAFWENNQRRQAAAAAQVVLAQDPFLTLALRFNGKRYAVWTELEFFSDRALPLDAAWLSKIRDDTIPPDLSKRELITDIKASEWAYRTIYRDALLKAFSTPEDIFNASAREFASVKWDQLMTNPGFYRGKVVGIEGKLRKLVLMDAPADIRPPVEHVYEAWIQTPDNPRPIICVFSNLPEELKPYENTLLKEPIPVSFTGYFIMRYKYLHKKEEVVTPMLIGQTITPGPPEVKEEESGFTVPLGVFLALGGIFLVVLTTMIVLNRWYKREDAKIMTRVNELRAAQAEAMLDGDMFRDEPPPQEAPLHDEVGRNGSPHGSPVHEKEPPKD